MADLIDIKIENGKFVFDATGDIVFVRGADRIRQQVEFRLSLWAGEWFLDETFGTPYLLRILGKSAVSIDAAVDALREQIMNVDGVLSINRLDYDFDNTARKLTIDVDIQSEYGVVTYQSAAQLDAAPQYEDRTAIDMRATELDPRIIVNSNPAHGIRGAGGFLVMTADGDYPAEMVNNVQVGRQLPARALTAFQHSSRTTTGVDINQQTTDRPGGGLSSALIGASGGGTEHSFTDVYDPSVFKVGDVVRLELMVKAYGGSGTGLTVNLINNNVALAVVNVKPDGSATVSQGFKGLKTIPYGGGWVRVTATFTLPATPSSFSVKYMLTNGAGSASFTTAGNYAEAVLVAHPLLSLDNGKITSIRPDDVFSSPAGSISIAKMYGASAVRVLLSNGQYYDLDFGNADHVNLPTNPYDVGDAYITRIEYRG